MSKSFISTLVVILLFILSLIYSVCEHICEGREGKTLLCIGELKFYNVLVTDFYYVDWLVDE